MRPLPLRLPAILAALLALGLAADASAQVCSATPDVCVVPASTADRASYLDAVINGDTTSTGDRQNANRIYELQRGAIYFLDSDIIVRGFDLRIRAQAGAGARPILYGVASEDGNSFPDPFFDQRGHIEISDLVMVGYIESQPGGVANIPAGFFRTNEAGFDLTLDGVVMSGTRGQHIRTQSANRNIRITNSLFANMGDLGRSNFGAGKAIDLRDGSVQNLFIQNTTFVNFQDRIIRHRASTGNIENFVFDHNTMINGVSYHGTLALGAVGASATITNNLWVDSFAAGSDSSDVVRQAEFDESGEVFASNGQPLTTWILSEPNGTTNWRVSNNVWTTTAAVDAFYAAYGDGGGDDGYEENGTDGDNDIVGPGMPLTAHIRSRISNPDAAFVEMDVDLVDTPDVMIDMLEWYRTPQSAGGAGRTKETGNFDRATDDFDRRPIEYFVQFPGDDGPEFDASYPTTSPAYTAGTNGCPVGDLNWFPGVDASACLVTAEQGGPELGRFALRSAPNPVTDRTSIRYTLDRQADVRLTVFDALGRSVATLVDAAQPAGDYDADWTVGGVAPGLYIVRLQADGAVATHRVFVAR